MKLSGPSLQEKLYTTVPTPTHLLLLIFILTQLQVLGEGPEAATLELYAYHLGTTS